MIASAIFGELFAAWLFGFSALISIINPPAGALIFHGMTRWLTEQERARLARAIAINSFIVLLAALFLGTPILGFFGISLEALRIAGGLTVAVAGWLQQVAGVPAEWQPWDAPVRLPAGTTMLMNATHLGCAPELEPVPVDWETLDRGCLVVDVITNPRITPFLHAARERGCPTVDGVEMLVQLAMQIFEQWTGLRPEEKVFQQSVAAALGEAPGS